MLRCNVVMFILFFYTKSMKIFHVLSHKKELFALCANYHVKVYAEAFGRSAPLVLLQDTQRHDVKSLSVRETDT